MTSQSRPLTNIEAIVLAISDRGGQQAPIDLEDIAVAADGLAPGHFRWRKYKDQINLYAIRYAVKDAQQAGLIQGTSAKGWQLTITGAELASQVSETLSGRPVEELDREGRRQRNQERARIAELNAYRLYVSGARPTLRDARAVFRLDEYSSNARIDAAIDRGRLLFKSDALEEFITAMAAVVRDEERD